MNMAPMLSQRSEMSMELSSTCTIHFSFRFLLQFTQKDPYSFGLNLTWCFRKH